MNLQELNRLQQIIDKRMDYLTFLTKKDMRLIVRLGLELSQQDEGVPEKEFIKRLWKRCKEDILWGQTLQAEINIRIDHFTNDIPE